MPLLHVSSAMTHRYGDAETAHLLSGAVEGDEV
jgi:hypothetical protein